MNLNKEIYVCTSEDEKLRPTQWEAIPNKLQWSSSTQVWGTDVLPVPQEHEVGRCSTALGKP